MFFRDILYSILGHKNQIIDIHKSAFEYSIRTLSLGYPLFSKNIHLATRIYSDITFVYDNHQGPSRKTV